MHRWYRTLYKMLWRIRKRKFQLKKEAKVLIRTTDFTNRKILYKKT